MFVTLYIAPPPTKKKKVTVIYLFIEKKKNNLQVSETLLYWLFFSLSNTHPSSTGMHLRDLCSPQTLLSAQSSQILIFSSSATSHVLFLSTCSVFLFIFLCLCLLLHSYYSHSILPHLSCISFIFFFFLYVLYMYHSLSSSVSPKKKTFPKCSSSNKVFAGEAQPF